MKSFGLVLLICVGLSSARWLRRGKSNQPKETSFIGEATNELSTALLQGYIDDINNIVFSPLGYSSILAILAEGAQGETKEQLVNALHLPKDEKLIRKNYRYIMERLKYTNKFEYNKPELQNYFYVYKNYSINEDYKKILQEFYLTDVRSVERYSNIGDDEEDKKIQDIEPPKENEEKLITYAVEDKPEKIDLSQITYKPAKNIKEQIKLVKISNEDVSISNDEEETMVADEARNHIRNQRELMNKNDIASSISVNGVGKKDSDPKSTSIMIIFNGMYFRGSWKKPFDVIEPGLFYKSNSEKKHVMMMKTRGKFMTGSLPELDSEALLLPYDGGRYALLVVNPRSRDGLMRLTADLPSASISDIKDSLFEEELQVSLPSFYVSTTTKPVAALAKFGVSRIFGRDAELSGISSKEGLFVQELVQNVVVRVDNTNSSASLIAVSDVVELKNVPLNEPRHFCVEHPFVFYIIDCLDNLVVVAGKVNDPEPPNDNF
ncbi:serpin B3 [Pieris rapae]|uniref:serpin B3 n=1 Tax=Pieris rapae TaxID=64459 RepID=UPI001E280232|nr:serpin B3 [Pieris rapae]